MRSFFYSHPFVLKGVRYFTLFLVLFLIVIFLFRNILISYYFDQRAGKFNRKYNAELRVVNIHTLWPGELIITGLTFGPVMGDTLLKADTVRLSLNLLKFLTGHIVIRKLEMVNIRLSFIRHDTVNNWMFILRERMTNRLTTLQTGTNYAEAFDRLMGLIFDRIPRQIQIRNLIISGMTNGHEVLFSSSRFDMKNHSFSSGIRIKEDSLDCDWAVDGKIDPGEHIMAFNLYSKDDKKVRLPFLKYRWGAAIGMDTLSFSFHEEDSGDDRVRVDGVAFIRSLSVDQENIAVKPVLFDKLAIRYMVTIGKDFAELDSSTEVIFNKLRFNPYVRYRHLPSKQITLKIRKPDFPADELFSSFPEGLFTNLNGIKVKGDLSFYFNFFVDLAVPDSLIFNMDLLRHRFSVLSYGDAGLYKIDSSFLYTAYDRAKPVRAFIVGPENPSFRPLNKISPYLRYSVLTSEDGGFYQHRGFLQDAFRASVIQDIKERRFARGGSTISMQLVKNVFLSRNKTVGRKVEEALLVWLLENQGITTKDRMFEVYLNIIEWGPMIYGAGEASHFYFDKEPLKLTLAESIFLASIIPRPKWFIYSFDETGHLRSSMADYYRLVSGKMLSKGWIPQQDWDRLIPDIKLKGPAKLFLKKKEPVPDDSLMMFENQEEE